MIFIYDDGIHNNAPFLRCLQDSVAAIAVAYCNASDIINGCLNKATLLIMPGGADLYYCEKLNGAGNQAIQTFVQNGGNYLGICAGAYYACSALDWNHGEIDGARELSFYDGCATGPVYEWVENPDNVYGGSWVNPAPLTTIDGQTFLTHYNGGPVFSEPTSDTARVLARYHTLPNTPPAVIEGMYGKGRYILSSPHIERYGRYAPASYKHRNDSYAFEMNAYEILSKDENHQHDFWTHIIRRVTNHGQ